MKFIFPSFIFRIEKWKWNEEYRVYVSSLGNFKNEHKQNLPVKISNRKGYVTVKTECGYKLAHRLVLLTFKPIPDAENLTVDHLNHNKRDNSIYNLEWVTMEENHRRAKEDEVEVEEEKKERKLNDAENPKVTTSKNDRFASLDDAAKYFSNSTNRPKQLVAERITKAAKNGKEYFGRKWHIKEDYWY